MATKRSLFIALALLAVFAAAAIVCVVLLVLGRSRLPTNRAGASAEGISVVAGGITWMELAVVAGGLLTILFVLAASVTLLVSKRNRAES